MKIIERVFNQAPKAIVHLRGQLDRHRFGLIFGAGMSRELGFPTWGELVSHISVHKSVAAKTFLSRARKRQSAASSITRSLSTITQMLFSKYRERRMKDQGLTEPITFVQEQAIRSDWLKIIHTELYKGIDQDRHLEAIQKHPYLMRFQSIIKRSPMTVTYNFDDSIERMLYESRSGEEISTSRGYEVADRPNLQFQRESSVIYHPNGYLPGIFEDGSSPNVVFADDAFQDQLISAATGRYLHLSNHLFANTCLLIGISLDDSTLQSLLRQNAVNNPGNVHYIVHFIGQDQTLDDDTRDRIFKTNFESYNLYTLFLTNSEIGALADLLAMDKKPFELEFTSKKSKYVYYIIGSVGAGKSTVAGNFRNLITYDEWIDARKAELAVPESEVPESIDDVNEWVSEQFRKKNYVLSKCSEGIHLVDRCPLDPLTFGSSHDRPEKASRLIDKVTDKGARDIERGHVILLDCDLENVRIRNSFKHKYWKEGDYVNLLAAIQEIYGPVTKSVVCTIGRDPQQVAHEIAKVIFLADYRPVDVGAHLKTFVPKEAPAQ